MEVRHKRGLQRWCQAGDGDVDLSAASLGDVVWQQLAQRALQHQLQAVARAVVAAVPALVFEGWLSMTSVGQLCARKTQWSERRPAACARHPHGHQQPHFAS
jgi:hypothetical protein